MTKDTQEVMRMAEEKASLAERHASELEKVTYHQSSSGPSACHHGCRELALRRIFWSSWKHAYACCCLRRMQSMETVLVSLMFVHR